MEEGSVWGEPSRSKSIATLAGAAIDFLLQNPLTSMARRFGEDRALAARLLDGDRDAFRLFFDRELPRLFGFALPRVGGDESAAEDIVQSTLIKGVRKLHTFRGLSSLSTWLCAFCRHEISAHWRRRGRRREQVALDTTELEGIVASLRSSPEDDPEADLLRRETAFAVRATLERLPARYGEALELKYLQELSVREIGQRLGVGTTAAQSLLARARLAFRQEFDVVAVGLGDSSQVTSVQRRWR